MPEENAYHERAKFCRRLQNSLLSRGYSPNSANQITREFNTRYSGKPVSVHAVRKWLIGDAIPTQDKMRTLTQWLGVSSEWLRFGIKLDDKQATDGSYRLNNLDGGELSIMENLTRLDDEHKQIVLTLIHNLIRTQNPNTALLNFVDK